MTGQQGDVTRSRPRDRAPVTVDHSNARAGPSTELGSASFADAEDGAALYAWLHS